MIQIGAVFRCPALPRCGKFVLTTQWADCRIKADRPTIGHDSYCCIAAESRLAIDETEVLGEMIVIMVTQNDRRHRGSICCGKDGKIHPVRQFDVLLCSNLGSSGMRSNPLYMYCHLLEFDEGSGSESFQISHSTSNYGLHLSYNSDFNLG